MARRSANSLLNSLKGKIWLATSALAFFICTFGLTSYLLISFFIAETFFAVFIPFLLLSFTVMVFGWWLSNEVVSPIEKVSLLAKSLERSSLVSLPKTTGSTETDELLETLHRNSQQLQTIVGLMETVAGGDTNVVLTPLQSSDRLSSSFQKLLAKVTESIDAKQNLEKLETAIERVAEDIARVRKGNFDGEISSDFDQTREISESFKFLARNLNGIIAQVRSDASEARNTAVKARKTIRAVMEKDESVIQEMKQAAHALIRMPGGVRKISEELSASVSTAAASIEKARKGKQTAQASLDALGSFRRQLQEAVKRTGRLGECSREITKAAKAVEDLAHRTNLIALNASIQAVENTNQNFSFSILAEEVERLSTRAANTNKEISSLNKSLAAEILEVENSLKSAASEAANLSKYAIETGDSLSELEKYVGQFLDLQSKLAAYSSEQSAETQKSFEVFFESITVRETAVGVLKQSEADIANLSLLLENLQTTTGDFAPPPQPVENEIATASIISDEKNYADTSKDYEPIISA
jgi:methyl-accepting chemotaxis protein